MEFPFNINSSEAPDDFFSLINNLIASGTTADTDEIENADFSGLLPESSVPSLPTRDANAQQRSLVDGEIVGRESEDWNPYSELPPLSIYPPALKTEEPSSDDVAPPSSIVPAAEDENYALDLQPLLMDDLGTTDDFCNSYWDQLPLYIGDSNERSNEIVGDNSDKPFMQTNHLPEAVATPNSTAPTIEDENQALAMWLDSQIQYWPYRCSSMPSTKLIDEYLPEQRTRMVENLTSNENGNFRYGEVNGHEDDHIRRKVKVKDGCKGCKCKRTKCLQLYCKCFASGFYCDKKCTCKGCNYRIQSGPTVFYPSIVAEYPPVQSTIRPSPSGGTRHGRGCNCKKSKCTKKHCKCYKAGVKCSAFCRCKDCGNIYKQNDDFIIGEPMNNHVYSYGEMLPQRVVSFENGELLQPPCPSLRSDSSISTSFGNSMDDSTVFRGRRLAPFPPQLNPYSVAMGSSISSAFPLWQWPPTECSDLTFGPPPLPLMNCHGVSADHNNEGGSAKAKRKAA